MSQMTLDELLHTLNQLWVTHGGDIPVSMAYPTFGPVLPAWATETALRPVVEVCLDASTPDGPTVLLCGLGTALGESRLLLDIAAGKAERRSLAQALRERAAQATAEGRTLEWIEEEGYDGGTPFHPCQANSPAPEEKTDGDCRS